VRTDLEQWIEDARTRAMERSPDGPRLDPLAQEPRRTTTFSI